MAEIMLKFTLKALKYTSKTIGTVFQGWNITLHMDDPKAKILKQNKSFTMTKVKAPKVVSPKKKDDPPASKFEAVPITVLKNIDTEVITLLQDAGFATVKSLENANEVKLLSIEGIDETILFAIGNELSAFSKPPPVKFEDRLIEEVTNIDGKVIGHLQKAGYSTIQSVFEAGKEKLIAIKGIGDATATAILEEINAYVETLPKENKDNKGTE